MTSSKSFIYLDHSSTTPLHPRAASAMDDCRQECYGNPASLHLAGRRARQRLTEARDFILGYFHGRTAVPPADELIFTSGGTESNNLALRALSAVTAAARPGRVIISAIEHPSVTAAAELLRVLGYDIQTLPVSADGVVVVERLPDLIDDATRLVSVMLANNETGVIQPVAEIVGICRAHGIPVHTDATQAAGKIEVSFTQLGVTALTLAPHKFAGPRGIGCLLIAGGTVLTPILFGGGQQLGRRPGTESVELAVGSEVALRAWHDAGQEGITAIERLRDALQSALEREFPECHVHGKNVPRLPNILNVGFPGLDRQALLMGLDRAGLMCSSGSACSSGSEEPSAVLRAMGSAPEVVDGSIRLSLGLSTTPDEVNHATGLLVDVISQMYRRWRAP